MKIIKLRFQKCHGGVSIGVEVTDVTRPFVVVRNIVRATKSTSAKAAGEPRTARGLERKCGCCVPRVDLLMEAWGFRLQARGLSTGEEGLSRPEYGEGLDGKLARRGDGA